MKQGIELQALVQRLTEDQPKKKDYVVHSNVLRMQPDGITLEVNSDGLYAVTQNTHNQIATNLKIPGTYYSAMQKQAPALLATNVNHWFKESQSKRMLRTIDQDENTSLARAFLSDSYRIIDHEEIASAVLPVLADIPELKIVSCDVTENKMYIKAVTPRVAGEVAKGDVVYGGVVIANSEIGCGAVSVTPLVYRLVCTNGLIMPDGKMQARHLGSRLGKDDDATLSLLEADTIEADNKALMLKVRDVTRAAISQDRLDAFIAVSQEMQGEKIEGRPDKAVTLLAKKTSLTDRESFNVLSHLLQGGDLSKWGMVNAVTRAAQDAHNYDRATEMETLGGRVFNMPKGEWKEVAEAA